MEVIRRSDSPDAKCDAVHAVLYLGYSISSIAKIFKVHAAMVDQCVAKWRERKKLTRGQTQSIILFTPEHKNWILDLVDKAPLLYLPQIVGKFNNHFDEPISSRQVFRILIEANYTAITIEKIAKSIMEFDVYRYFWDYAESKPLLNQLVFLEEFSIDTKSMTEGVGWFHVGSDRSVPLQPRTFVQKNRISCLAFINKDGLVDCYTTGGTLSHL
jgi:transposase